MTQSSDVQGNINKLYHKKIFISTKNGLYENIHTDRYTYTDINIQIRDVNMRLL